MDKTPSPATLLPALGPLLALSVLGWGLILWAVANMGSPLVALTMPLSPAWRVDQAIAVFLMWSVMMGAMMLPSALPQVTTHHRLTRETAPRSGPGSTPFLVGYLAAWTLFSLGATALQWGFQSADALSHMLKLQDSLLAGAILILAGLFQLAPQKQNLLTHCRAPDLSMRSTWKPGRIGAVRMGFDEGLCCIGCCWALMLVLFVGGAMSLPVIIALTLAVAVEKLAPLGEVLARLGSVPLIACGLWIVAG